MNLTKPAIDAAGIAFAIYHVTDIARARQFYGGTLGLKAGMEMEFSPGKWWIEYDAGPAALAITNFDLPTTNSHATPGVALEVNNYEEALALVRAAGIELTWGPHDFPVCHCFAIKDPEGNDLYIHRRKPAA